VKENKLKKKSLDELPEKLPGEEGEYIIMWEEYRDVAVFVDNDFWLKIIKMEGGIKWIMTDYR